MTHDFLVLPSPLLGPAAYRPLGRALAADGSRVRVADLPSSPFSAEEVLAGFVDQVRAHRTTVLLAHSNAGYYAPAVAAAGSAVAVLYVDAALALPTASTTPLAPPALVEQLHGLVDEAGVLARWTDWWPDEEVLALFPSKEWLDLVRAEQPRVSLAYLESTIGVPDGWSGRASGYLAFGATYAAEAEQARDCGWPVAVMEGSHLWHLWEPERVAEVLVGLLAILTGS